MTPEAPLYPDIPPGAPIYDEAEAVRYTTAWTGFSTEVVSRVLEAKWRYLALAGIAVVEEDEALLREREAHRDLLPKVEGHLDEGETAYVLRVTGESEETVRRIDQGELAYSDSLGLMDWQGEEERDRSLGAPNLPEDDPTEASPPEGHGDHWACIRPDPETWLLPHLRKDVDMDDLRMVVDSPNPRWGKLLVHGIPQAVALETWGMVGITRDERQAELLTAFPVALGGAIHALILHKTTTWSNGVEALVEASTGFGALLSFFDVSFLHPHHDWSPEDVVEVRLAGFAYAVEPAPDTVIPITSETTIRTVRAHELGVAPEDVQDLSPLEVHTGGMASLFPSTTGSPDDCSFQGKVLRVETVQAWGQALLRLEVAVMVDTSGEEDQPFIIPIYAAPHALQQGWVPEVDDEVRGGLWLQGLAARLPFPILESGD